MFFKPWQPLAPLALFAIGGIIAADFTTSSEKIHIWIIGASVAGIFFLLAIWAKIRKIGWRNPVFGIATVLVWIATAALFFSWHSYLLTSGPGPALAARIPPRGCVVEAIGIVNEEPAENVSFKLRLESITLNGQTLKTSAPVIVRWMNLADKHFQYGDRLKIFGDLHLLSPPRNPGVFDSPHIWQRQGIYTELRVRFPNDTLILDHHCGSPFIARALALRHWMEKTTALDIEDSPELVSMIHSMVLGSHGESISETRNLFQYTGTMHFFVVSGLNVVMLATITTWLLQVAGVNRRVAACIVIPAIWIYCYASGLTSSSLRATIMVSLFLISLLLDRPSRPWNTLGAATLAVMIWSPSQLFTPGFQLSFGMVGYLMAVASPAQEWMQRFALPDPFLPRALWSKTTRFSTWIKRKLAGAFAVSTVAWIGVMPLTLYYFHIWSPATIPANLFAVLLTWLLLFIAIASVLTGIFCHWLPVLFNNTNWLAAKILFGGLSWLAAFPGGHKYVEFPSFKAVPVCDVEVLDIPDGGAIHLRTNAGGRRRDWMVDCGSASAFKYQITPCLRSRGVNNLDGYLLTHGDSHHVGGSMELLREMHPMEVFDSPLKDRSSYRKNLHQTLENSGKGKTIVMRGDALTLAPDVTLHVLFPPEGLSVSRADDKAIVFRLDACGKRILFTSDAGFLTESWLLEHADANELRSDILVKQKHASDFSGTPDFLAAVHPALIVASSAPFPPEAHITDEWVSRVEELGIRLLRQDQTGAVKITLNADGSWKAEPFLKE